jgi:glutamyl-tRNA(Gln) amidotransferase subunit D
LIDIVFNLMAVKNNYTEASQFLTDNHVEPGDKVELTLEGQFFTGIIMPKHKFSAPDILTIKLMNGYNLGLAIDSIQDIKLLEKGPRQLPIQTKTRTTSSIEPRSKICIISTGGTIASYLDYRTGAVHPARSTQDLIFSSPEINDIVELELKLLFNELSENITPKHWTGIAKEIIKIFEENLKKSRKNSFQGLIIPHGTDTIGYTSAALSFMLGDKIPIPIVLTGSQRSSDRPSSDANQNLMATIKFILNSDLCGVLVAMHSSSSDGLITIHRGTNVRKLHTSRRDAFRSVNRLPIGIVDLTKDTIKISSRDNRLITEEKKPQYKLVLNERVGLIYIYPSISTELLENSFNHYDGLVLAGTGLGHVPENLLQTIRSGIAKGKHIVMTSQCLFGRVNLNVYSSGRDLLEAGVIPGEDMLPETAYVKLMWVLGQTSEPDEVRRMMSTNFVGEISEYREMETFS